MLLRAQPIFDAFDAIEKKSPRHSSWSCWKQFDQAYAEDLAQEEELIFICGHYEGYDERIKTFGNRWNFPRRLCFDWREVAAMTMIDATVRLIPEVIGKGPVHRMIAFLQVFSNIPRCTTPLWPIEV